MDTLDIGKTEGIKSIPSYFSAGKKAEEEEDIPDMDTYEDTGNDSVVRKTVILSSMWLRKAHNVHSHYRFQLCLRHLILGYRSTFIFCRRRA